MRICCVCGFRSRRGVLWGFTGAVSMVLLACERCFRQPFLSFPCKRHELPRVAVTIPLDKWLREGGD